jgi:hypothetical protein
VDYDDGCHSTVLVAIVWRIPAIRWITTLWWTAVAWRIVELWHVVFRRVGGCHWGILEDENWATFIGCSKWRGRLRQGLVVTFTHDLHVIAYSIVVRNIIPAVR